MEDDARARPLPSRVAQRRAPDDGGGAPRLLIGSHVRLFREGLSRILDAAGVDVVALATAETVVADAQRAQPDVAILDVTMPDALDVLRRLVDGAPALRVVAVGVADDERDVVACAEAGAVGYVSCESGAEQLLATIASVTRGEVLCSPRVAALLFRRIAARPGAEAKPTAASPLTRREGEVLALIDRGLSNKEIAAHLRIGITTVKNHVHSILEKLHAGRRGEAAALARGALRQRTLGSRAGGNGAHHADPTAERAAIDRE